ncbi:unnamed protein product, partial [marine sediment metagenome]
SICRFSGLHRGQNLSVSSVLANILEQRKHLRLLGLRVLILEDIYMLRAWA